MHVLSLALLFLLLHGSLQQSGDAPEAEDDEDNEMKPDFDCFSKIRISKILVLCNVTKSPPGMVNNITFKVRNLNKKAKKWSENKYFVFHLDILGEYEVCIVREKSHYCKNIDVKKIAIPDNPYNLTITYNTDLMEYVLKFFLTYDNFEYLRERMYHEIVLRKEGTPWPIPALTVEDTYDKNYRPLRALAVTLMSVNGSIFILQDCNEKSNIGSYKVYFKTMEHNLHIPKRNLEYSTKYEARVRSIPTGGYYDGFWSPWSAITTFWTEEEPVTEAGYGNNTIPVVLGISIIFFLLIIVILIAVYWNSRIKPLVWPEIPDHKKTLEKFINKPKQNPHLSFNPDYNEILPINIIDYMKEQEIPEENYEIGITDSLMEKPSINLSPPGGSRGFPSNTNNSGHCKSLGDDGGDRSENPIISSTATLLPGDGVPEKCNVSNGITSVAVKHPGIELRGLCWEDIYIAMSAFKTPSSAVKQVPKNTF